MSRAASCSPWARPSARRTCCPARWRCGAATPSRPRAWEPAVRGRHAAGRAASGGRGAPRRRLLRAGRHREVLAEAQVLVRAAPLRERALGSAGPRAVPVRPAGARRCGTIHQLKGILAEQSGPRSGPGRWSRSRTSILRQDTSLLVADGARPVSHLSVPGPQAVRRRGRGPFFGRDDDVAACLEPARTRCSPWSVPRARASPRWSGPGWRRPCGATGTPVSSITPGCPPHGVADRARSRARGGPGGGPVRGGVLAVRRTPSEQRQFLRALTAEASSRGRWSSRCAPTTWPTSPPTRPSRVSSNAGCTCSARWARQGLRSAIEDTGAASGAAARAGSGRPARPRGRGTTPARCRCCRTRCARPGSDARAAP